MKTVRLAALAAAALAIATSAAPASAHRTHLHFGLAFGAPAYWSYPWPYYYSPAFYYPPAYYYPPVVTVPSAPTRYIEKSDAEGATGRPSYWYYCPEAKAYYPYVKQCAGGWQKVAPTPSEGR